MITGVFRQVSGCPVVRAFPEGMETNDKGVLREDSREVGGAGEVGWGPL